MSMVSGGPGGGFDPNLPNGSPSTPPTGLLTPGTINLADRPIAFNPDGTFSTVRSISITDDKGRAILLPTVSPAGVVLSNPDAIKLYQSTGHHLGIFDNEDSANAYGEQLHAAQLARYGPIVAAFQQQFEKPATKQPAPKPSPSRGGPVKVV